MTITEFCNQHGITLALESAGTNPNMPDPSMNHYKARLYKEGGGSLIVPFSTGSGWDRAPKVNDVFNCLLSDYTTESFEDWASNFGYDTDSRKAEKTYRACLSQSQKLRNFLGEDLLEQVLYSCERE